MSDRREFMKHVGFGSVALAGIATLTHDDAWANSEIPTPRTVWESKGFTADQLGTWPSDVSQHIALYEGYVKKANEMFEMMKRVDRDPAKQSLTYSELRELKVEYSFAVGGIKNHEIYFGHLGSAAKDVNALTGRIKAAIEANFGNLTLWEADFRATGLSARGWAWLAWDRDKKTLFNYIGDSQNTFPVWNAVPILALDMFEHAYFKDYGRDRNSYISDFMARVEWAVVERSLAQAIKTT